MTSSIQNRQPDCGEVRSAASSGGTLMQMMEGSRFAALYMRSVAEN